MKVIIDTTAIVENIKQAESLANIPISLMFKDFYEDIYPHIKDRISNKVFGLNLDGSVCYSIGKARKNNSGSIITSFSDFLKFNKLGIKDFYIPINAEDNREGLSIYEVDKLCKEIRLVSDCKLHGMITSGCISDKAPDPASLYSICGCLSKQLDSISIGGSYWLGQLKDYKFHDIISDIRIGEFMLYGTIPYNDTSINGTNGIELKCKIIGIYPDRNEFIIDCGYNMANIDKCKLISPTCFLQYVDSSSEYSIFKYISLGNMKIGDELTFIPDYKSLVKLRYADREFK